MSIFVYINNIKNALRTAELELDKGEDISEYMSFAFEQIQQREQVCGESLKDKNIAYSISIFMAKYLEIDVNFNLFKAWKLLGVYQEKMQKGFIYDALEVYFSINDLVRYIYIIYNKAVNVGKENIKICDIQPFSNIPENLTRFIAAIHGPNSQVHDHMDFSPASIAQSSNRFGMFQQARLIEQDNIEHDNNVNVISNKSGKQIIPPE